MLRAEFNLTSLEVPKCRPMEMRDVPKKMVFDPQPGNGAVDTPFNVAAELLDKYGNAVDDGSTVDLVLGSHPRGAANLNLTSAVSDGFADFDGITLDTAGKYTLKTTEGKLKATSKKFVAV